MINPDGVLQNGAFFNTKYLKDFIYFSYTI